MERRAGVYGGLSKTFIGRAARGKGNQEHVGEISGLVVIDGRSIS